MENTVENGQETLNLSDSGCYYDITPMRTRKLCGISGRRLNVIRDVILSIALDRRDIR